MTVQISQLTNHRPLLIAIVLLVIFAIGISLYYFVWRVPTSTYEAAVKNLQSLDASTTAVANALKTTQQSTDISDATISTLKTSLSQYNNDLQALTENAATKQDTHVRPIYTENVTTLNSYNQSMNKLVDSLQLYWSLLSTCTTLTGKLDQIATTGAFDTAAKDCSTAIDKARSAPSASFNDQFLSKYVALASSLLQAYRQLFVQADAKSSQISYTDITTLRDNITVLSKTTKLQLAPEPNPAAAIHNITAAVNSQKGKIIR